MPTKTIAQGAFYTVAEANARLPLVRSILRDVTELAQEMKVLHEQVILLQTSGSLDPGQDRELASVARELDLRQAKMNGYEKELKQIGAELKDTYIGLIDFPGMIDGREVCLCFKLGEPAVAYWHETDAGYAGRLPLNTSRGNA